MKRILQMISSIVLVMVIGCNRESASTRGSVAMSHKPKHGVTSRSSTAVVSTLHSAEKDSAFKERERQYERMKELAKEVSQACAGTNGEDAVDALLAKVGDVLDAYVCCAQGHEISERTSLVSPFVRDVKCYWSRRRFLPGETPPENLLNEVRLSHSLATKTVDLLQKKVGNPAVTAPFEIGNCSILKWLTHNFERVGWKEEKQYVDSMVENWIETRYDMIEGNPLKDACEDVEFHASKDPNREKRHPAVYSRTKNRYLDMAVHIVGRLPKWFAAWTEEMERTDRSKAK